ncbi:hypothetical protein DMC30DRAFT_391809 [Rhodotorula diobovata]|uniref:F-box domain-containing protein n=1 Tax=Rhodotorula diobovata TaxID=5288 RepID=A0A5C5G084_9BASI|nr:hypothetical protein DMC30DRAFT_391809 [Rhodotorula diobovata]
MAATAQTLSAADRLPVELVDCVARLASENAWDGKAGLTLTRLCRVSKRWCHAVRTIIYGIVTIDLSPDGRFYGHNHLGLVATLDRHAHLRAFTHELRAVLTSGNTTTAGKVLDLILVLPALVELEIECKAVQAHRLAVALEQTPNLTTLVLRCPLTPRLVNAIYRLDKLEHLEVWNEITVAPSVRPTFRLKSLMLGEPTKRRIFEDLTAASTGTLETLGICVSKGTPLDVTPFARVQSLLLCPPEEGRYKDQDVIKCLGAIFAASRHLPEMVQLGLVDRVKEIRREWPFFQPRDRWLLQQLPPTLEVLDLSAAHVSFDPQNVVKYVADKARSKALKLLFLREDEIWFEDQEELEARLDERGIEVDWRVSRRDEQCVIT